MNYYFHLFTSPQLGEVQDPAEQEEITVHINHAINDEWESSDLRLEFWIGNRVAGFHNIFEGLNTLYVCPSYGQVKVVRHSEKPAFLAQIVSIVEAQTKDTDKLIQEGLGHLEYLLRFAKVIKEQIQQKNDFLFVVH